MIELVCWGKLNNVWWFLLAALLISITWYKYLARNRQAAQLDVSGKLLRYFSARRNIIKALCSSVAIVSLFLALLHPKWGKVEELVEQQGRDLFIALDVSRSMLAQDIKPDRLSCAKKAIKDLIADLETDRIALMLFSEKARIYCPLTKDRALVNLFIDQIDQSTIGAGTTLLDQPIKSVLEQCERVPHRKNRLLVLVTDGEDFSSSLSSLKAQAHDQGLTIFVLGIGTSQGAPIPIFNEKGRQNTYLKDKKGQVVISQLNEGALCSLSHETGGIVAFAQEDKVNVKDIIRKIENFEKEQQGEQKVAALQEQYPWFLLVSFIALLLEWVL